MSRSHRPPAAVRALGAAGALGVAALVAHNAFGLGGPRLDGFFSDWVYDTVIVISAVLCLARAALVRTERPAWLILGAGLVAWGAGEIYFSLTPNAPETGGPGLSDALWLAFYPASYTAIVLLGRSRLRHASARLWLDGLVAALAAACLAATVLFEPILGGTAEPGSLMLTDVAYPIGDLLLLAFVMGVLGLTGWRPGRSWMIIGAGFAVTAAADGAFLYQAAAGTYAEGTVLDVLWPACTLLLGAAAWLKADEAHLPDSSDQRVLAIPSLCTIAALGILVYGNVHGLNDLAVGLAAATLLTAILRTTLSFADNARLAGESRREALTDALTALGNRRRVMSDLEHAFSGPHGGNPHTLALFDLDGFKNYNDVFGHPAGDELLARLARKLEGAVHGNGHAYRLGGDEFCVLLEGTSAATDVVLAAAVDALTDQGHGFDVGCSHGAARLPEEAQDRTSALKLADQRLYAQKFERRRDAITEQTCDALLQVLHEREPDLRDHVGDVAELALRVGRRLGLGADELEDLRRAAELHDVGKSAVPDAILSKPGPLDPREWAFVRQHTLVGERILKAAPALSKVASLVRSSHERYDGAGYPDGLAGEQIPLGARIVAACDAWDAMTTTRPYRLALTAEAALAEVRRCGGTQFDPDVVTALCVEVEVPAVLVRPATADTA